MAKDKVAILMSTYNGEKYLRDQIESIQHQSYQDWHLYIRDDGSKDNTVKIINEYTDADQRITLISETRQQNLGVMRSFLKLLEMTDADYYMFSDQDDYWKKDKVAITLEAMKNSEELNLPICVHTNLTIVDSKLKGSTLMKDNSWSGFRELLFANCVTGCTMMINQALKDRIDFKNKTLKNLYMHDWWLALIAAAFGKVTYLDQSTILYRQHTGNLVGSNKKGTKWYHNTVEDSVNVRVIQTVRMAKDFWNVYGQALTGVDQKYTRNYASLAFHRNPFWNLQVVLKCPPVRPTFKGNLLFASLVVKDFKMLNELGKNEENQ